MLMQADHVAQEVELEVTARRLREADLRERRGAGAEARDEEQRQRQQRRLRQLEFGQWRRGLLVSLARSAAPKASAHDRNSSRFKKRVQNARWRLWAIDNREAERLGTAPVISGAWTAGPRFAPNPLEADSCSSNPNLLWARGQGPHRGAGQGFPFGAQDGPDDDHEGPVGAVDAAEADSRAVDGGFPDRGMTPSPALGGTMGPLIFELDEARHDDYDGDITSGSKASAVGVGPLISAAAATAAGAGSATARKPWAEGAPDTDVSLSSSASDSSLSAGETASLAAAIPQRTRPAAAQGQSASKPRPMMLHARTPSSMSTVSASSYEFPRRPDPWRALRPLRETAAGPDTRWLAPTSLLVGDAAHQRAVRKLVEASPYVLKGHFRARLAAGRGNSRWHKRFYVLTENFLFEYESRKDPVPLACVALAELMTSVTTAGSLLISFERPESPPLASHARAAASMHARSPETMAAGVERLRWQQRRFEGGSVDDPGKGDLETRIRTPRGDPGVAAEALESSSGETGEDGGEHAEAASGTKTSLPPPPPILLTHTSPAPVPLQASHSGGDLCGAEQNLARSSDNVIVELQPLAGQDVRAWRAQIQFNASLRIADLYAINVDERLGVGRYAEVHECTRATDGRRSAVKVVNKSDYFELIAMGKERPSALAREISTQAYLADRMVATGRDLGCAPILRVFETPSLLVIETELMDRRNLFELLRTSKDRRFSEIRAADVAISLLRILQQLQYYRVAHRDIKLSNVALMRGRGDRFKYLSPFELRSGLRLIDFGMATYIDSQNTLTGRCGTPGYVAPEILVCKSGGRYPSNVDIFSVGVVVCTLLCGREPFQRETMQETMQANRNCEYDLSSEDISKEALDFLAQVLAQDPQKRPTPAQALAHPWLAAQPRPPPRIPRATPPVSIVSTSAASGAAALSGPGAASGPRAVAPGPDASSAPARDPGPGPPKFAQADPPRHECIAM